MSVKTTAHNGAMGLHAEMETLSFAAVTVNESWWHSNATQLGKQSALNAQVIQEKASGEPEWI